MVLKITIRMHLPQCKFKRVIESAKYRQILISGSFDTLEIQVNVSRNLGMPKAVEFLIVSQLSLFRSSVV